MAGAGPAQPRGRGVGLKGRQSADGGAPVLTQYFLEQVVYLNRIETSIILPTVNSNCKLHYLI